MTSFRKFSIVLLVMAALAGLMAAPAQALTVTCSVPSSATVGASYAWDCQAIGGTGPYTLALSVGSLPSGMTGYFPPAGNEYLIDGTPTIATTYSFTIQATDSTGATASQALTVSVTSAGGNTGTGGSTITLSSVSPSTLTAGVATGLTIFGSGFTANSVVYFNGTPVSTSYQNSTELIASISYNLVNVGTLPVYVHDNATGASSTSLYVTVTSSGSGGSLSLSSISPTSTPVGTGFTLNLYGSGFTQGALVSFGSYTLSSTFISSGQASVYIPSNYVATAQTISVSIGGSNTESFTIGVGGSTGTLSVSCTPNYGPQSTGIYFSQFCSVSGGNGNYLWSSSNLPPGVALNSTTGSSIGISGYPSSLTTYTITVNDSSGRTGSLTLSPSGTGGGSGNLTSVSPSSASIGSADTTVIFYGYGFTTSSFAYFNGNQLATQYVSTSQVNATIPSYLLQNAGTYSVDVITSGSASNTLPFTVGSTGTSGVSLSSISPNSVAAGSSAITLTLFGSGFSVGQLVSFGSTTFSPAFISSGQLQVTIPSQYLTTSQTVNVSVGGSNSIQFVIGSGSTGTLSISCSPTTGPSALNSYYTQTCTVSGGTAPYYWTVSNLPTGLSQSAASGSSTLTISGTPTVSQNYAYTVQANDSASHTGSLSISGTVGTSGSSYSITSLTPSSVSVGSAGITLTVFGNGFTTASLVYYNGAQLSTQYVSSNQLNATLPSYYLTAAQTASVSVNSSGVYTNSLTFTVGSGSTSGALTVVCTPGTGPSVVGTAYTSTCTASGGNQPYNWTVPSGLPAYLTLSGSTGPTITITGTPNVAAVYNFLVKVTDSSSPVQTGTLQLAGETTNASTGSGSILLTSVSPSSAPVNSAAISMTVNGSGFSTNSQVLFDGFSVTTTYLSGNQLLAVVPAGLLTYARAALVSVTTPGTGSSNALTFIVGNGGTGVQVSINCSPGVGPVTPNSYYTTNCGVSGGVGPYSWSIVNGSLPAGLNLNLNGPLSTITGYTTLNGTYSYTLQVTDSSSPSNTATLVFAGQTGAGSGSTTGLSLSTVSPSSIAIGSPATTITVTGSNFSSSALVYFNGSPLSTTFVNAGQLNATIPASSLTAAENASITVISSGLTSNALTFVVGTVSTTGMTITCNPAIGPSSAGSTYTTTCNVSGGLAPYTWTGLGLPFGLAVTNSNTNTVSITGTIYSGGYNYTLQVTDSSKTPLTATYPFIGSISGTAAATISSMSPISVPAGSGSINLVLTGTGFVSGVTSVQFGNTFLATTVNSYNQLTATVPASLLTSPGDIVVQLSGTASNSADFFVTTGGASGVTPASLTFTYGIGGSLPAAQTLTVTSLNGATGFSAVPSGNANGVSWLVLNQPSGAIPGSLSVSVAPGSLPIGSYSGTLTLTGFGVGTSVVIPVTLNVVGPPALVPSTTNLTLTTPTGSTTTQTIKVTTSDGTTVLPYSITATSNNGGNWLSVSPTTGTTPGSFTVTATTGNLTPSTYSGTITLVSTGSLGSQVAIPVTLIVTAPASITATPTSLSFSGVIGQGNPANQNITVSASNNVAVNYTVVGTTQQGGGWLGATTSGTTPGTIAVSINTANLTAATYNGTVTITAPGATNSPVAIPITLVLTNPPGLTGSPQSLTFNYQVGGATPSVQTLSVSGPNGAGNFNFSVAAATTTGGSWLSTSPTSGTTPSSVNVSVNPTGLAAGSYSGTLTVTASGTGTLTVPVTLTVTQPSATLAVSPAALTFSAPVGGSAPAAQSVAVTTTNNIAANYTVAASSSGNWLQATASGTTPGNISVSVNQTGLAIGTYTGTLTITSAGATNSPQTVQVTLNVASPPSITAVPANLSFVVLADGSTPAPQSVTIISTGANTAFTTSAVSQGGNWLTVSAGGTTPASVTATVNPAGLLTGQTYNGSITISAPGSNPSSLQIPVTLSVAATGSVPLQVAPQQVYLSYTQGAGTDLQHVAVLNNGGGTINFTAQAQTANCGNWLAVVTPTGSATASSPGILAFDVNPTGLTTQTCRGMLIVNDGNGNITNVPVYMAVSGAVQSVLLSQTAMNFTAAAGGSAPVPQTFQILNPGSGSMSWSITTKVLSGSGWLSASPNSGTSQSLAQVGSPINVTVNPQGLSAGTYYGSVLVTSSGAFNSPQAITVAFTVLASGTNPPEQITPNGVILTAAGGPSNTQTVNVSNMGSGVVTFSSAVITDDGQNWLSVSPTSGSIAAGGTNALTLTAATSALSTGLRHGTLRVAFSDGTVQTVDVQLALSGSAGAGSTGVNSCGASNLALEFLSPSQNFQASANVAIPLQVLVTDCSGNQLTNSSTGVDVLVGSSDIRLNYTGSGVWAGTWTPAAAAPAASLTARAVEITGSGAATGAVTATGVVAVAGANAPPFVAAVVNAGSFLLPGLVAPGTMVSIFGANLTDGQSQVSSTPFPNTLQGAQFTLRGLPLPLFYASSGQVNGIIPLGLNADERDQLVVVRDTTQSAPVDLLVADVDPGAFATNQQGTGQGAILVGGTAQVAAPAGTVQGAGPATAGQTVSIFLSGLGAVSNPPADGSPSSSANLSLTTVNPTVTIGGVPATVVYSGLAPGEVGLYQVNVQVPPGVSTGNAVPVVISIGNGISNTVTMAIM